MTSRKIFLINWEDDRLIGVGSRENGWWRRGERVISSFFQGIFLQSKMKQQPEEVGSRKFFVVVCFFLLSWEILCLCHMLQILCWRKLSNKKVEIDVVGNRIPFFFFSFLFIYSLCWVFIATHGFFSSWGWRRLLFIVVHGLLTAVASLVAKHRLQGAQAPVVAARGLSRFSCGPWGTGPVDLVKGL